MPKRPFIKKQRGSSRFRNTTIKRGGAQTEEQKEILGIEGEALIEPEKCSICYDDFDLKPIKQLYCGHTFHTDCIKKWIKTTTDNNIMNGENKTINCPLCRNEILLNGKKILHDENIKQEVGEYCSLKDKAKHPLGLITDWDVSFVSNMSDLFYNNQDFNETLNWDVSNVTNMKGMFFGCTKFNNGCGPGVYNPLKWNVSKATNLEHMFAKCTNFNQELLLSDTNTNALDTKKKSLSSMFYECTHFNNGCKKGVYKPLDLSTLTVTGMEMMFAKCTNFNQEIFLNLSNDAKSIKGLFYECTHFNNGCDPGFNKPLTWDASNVTEMSHMFQRCTSFNQPLNWDVSNVRNMSCMFLGCTSFNQPLNWDVSNVRDMSCMFKGCTSFNQPLAWNVSKVKFMIEMFRGCTIFNQPLYWDVKKVEDMHYMFQDCTSLSKKQPFGRVFVGMYKGCTQFTYSLKKIYNSAFPTRRNIISLGPRNLGGKRTTTRKSKRI